MQQPDNSNASRSLVFITLTALVLCLAAGFGLFSGTAAGKFGGVLALLALATRPTRPGTPRLPLLGIVALYALAKVCEGQDAALFALSDGLLAGHTLKHLVAVGAAALAIRALNARRR